MVFICTLNFMINDERQLKISNPANYLAGKRKESCIAFFFQIRMSNMYAYYSSVFQL